MTKIFLFLSFVFLLPQVVPSLAQDSNVIVTGFTYPRNRYPIIHPNGGQPTIQMNTTQIYFSLHNLSGNNFSPTGVSKCSLDFESIPHITSLPLYYLVDEHGNRNADIFFGGQNEVELNDNEKIELFRFLNEGGIVFVAGDVNASGPAWNPLLSPDSYTQNLVFIDPSPKMSDIPLLETPLTNGPFGVVNEIEYSHFRELNSVLLDPIYRDLLTQKTFVLEGSVGNGYLIANGDTFYTNPFWNNTDNKNYFLNMFAYACDKKLHPEPKPHVLLDVPSMKQGLTPFDGLFPLWESSLYDNADENTLWCGATMAQCGCATSSIAMVMSYYGINQLPNGDTIDPSTLNAAFANKDQGYPYGYYQGNVIWNRASTLSALADVIYPLQPKLEVSEQKPFDSDDLKALLDAGTPVLVEVDTPYGGVHWVVVKGYLDDGRFILNDPIHADPPAGEYVSFEDYDYTPRRMKIYVTTNSDYRSIEVLSLSDDIQVFDEEGNQVGEKTFEPAYQDATGQIGIPPVNAGIYSHILHKVQGDFSIVVPEGEDALLYVSDISGTNTQKYDIEGVFDFVVNENGVVEEKKPEPREIIIDIRPGVRKNYFTVGHGIIPVSIVSNEEINAVNDIEQDTLRFGETGQEDSLLRCLRYGWDTNRDGVRDLVCFFETKQTGFTKETEFGILTAETQKESVIGGDSLIPHSPHQANIWGWYR